MKLTNRTTPQAKNHQCNICKRIFSQEAKEQKKEDK